MITNNFDKIFNNSYVNTGFIANPQNSACKKVISKDYKNNSEKVIITGIILVGLLGLAFLLRNKISAKVKDIVKVFKTKRFERSREKYIAELEKLKDEYNSWWQPVKESDGKTVRETMLGQNIYHLKGKVYDRLRLAKYPEIGDKNIAEITRASTDKITVNPQNGWHYRSPLALSKNSHTVERISLNVRPEKALIEKLDDYFSRNVDTVKGSYKTPASFDGWSGRHDPITIYLYQSARESNVLEDIAKIAKPYVRETGSTPLLGKKFADGCAWQISPSQKDKMEIIKRIKALFGEKTANKVLGFNRDGNVSSGEVCAYNEILNRITGQNIKVLEPV